MDLDNPYAPSEHADLPAPAGVSQGLPWNPSEILGIAWDRFKEHWVVLFFALILTGILARFPEWIGGFIINYGGLPPGSAEALLVGYGGTVIGWLIDCYLAVGLVRIFVQAARGEQSPELGVLFAGFDRFLPILVVSFVVQLSIVCGVVLLIVPGIFFACVFYIADYLAVDQRLGPIEALKTSWQLTRGHRLNLVVLGVYGVVVGLIGVLACGIGLAAAKAVMGVCAALVYLRLIGEHAPGARVRENWA